MYHIHTIIHCMYHISSWLYPPVSYSLNFTLSVRVPPIQIKHLFWCTCVPSWLHGHTCTSFHAATVEVSIKNQKNSFVANYEDKNLLPKQHVHQFNWIEGMQSSTPFEGDGNVILFCCVCSMKHMDVDTLCCELRVPVYGQSRRKYFINNIQEIKHCIVCFFSVVHDCYCLHLQ
jgi:hypothetical protein